MINLSSQPVLDDQLEALGRLERRRLLLRLSAAGPHDDSYVDFGELDRDAGELEPLMTMRHLHLPFLEEREFIRWDRDTHRVTKGSEFDELEPLLQLLREIRDDLPGKWV